MNQLETLTNLFEEKEKLILIGNDDYISIFSLDVISALVEPKDPRKYWSVLKTRLKKEGSEVTTNCSHLKLKSKDGKYYL